MQPGSDPALLARGRAVPGCRTRPRTALPCGASSYGTSRRPRIRSRMVAPDRAKEFNVDGLVLYQQPGAEYILAFQSDVQTDAG
jgi:hypothetical protein